MTHAEQLLAEPEPVRVLGVDQTRRGRPRWSPPDHLVDARQTTLPSAARRAALREEAQRLAGAAAAAEAEHRRRDEVAAVAASVAGLLGSDDAGQPVPDDDPAALLTAALDAAEARIATRLDAVRMRHAVIADRIGGLEDAIGELDRCGGRCPVCRRPLGPDEAENARPGHLTEIAALEQERGSTPTGPRRRGRRRRPGR